MFFMSKRAEFKLAKANKARIEERMDKKYYSVVLFSHLKTHIFFFTDMRSHIALLVCK